MRAAPFLDLHYPLLMCRVGARRKLLVLTLILADALSSRSWSGAIRGRFSAAAGDTVRIISVAIVVRDR